MLNRKSGEHCMRFLIRRILYKVYNVHCTMYTVHDTWIHDENHLDKKYQFDHTKSSNKFEIAKKNLP